ncbi:MAG: hypothetical protein F4W92_07775 [Gammaproteobacteria bacterium]|nr:hypothetical protein [Gammaproteobacteria bacterium]
MFAYGITDLIAALAFGVSYFFFFDQNIYSATVLFMIVLAAQFMIFRLVFNWKISNLMWTAFGVAMTTVVIAMVFQDPIAIKWRPTVVFWTISAVCFLALVLDRKKILQWILGRWMFLFQFFWTAICVVFGITYLLAGIANLVVAYAFNDKAWVLFVIFAWTLTGLIVHAVAHIVVPLMREEFEEKVEHELLEMEEDLPATE